MEGIRIPGLQNPTQNQNLIKQVHVEKPGRPPGFYQSFVLDGLVVGSAVWFSYSYRAFVSSLSWPDVFFCIVACFLFFAFSVLQMLLHPGWTRRAFVIILEASAIVCFFYEIPWSYLLGVTAATAVFLAWGEILAIREVANSLEIKIVRIIRTHLNKAVSGMALAAVLLYLPYWNVERSFISETTFNTFYGKISEFSQRFYPELRLNGTIANFSQSIARIELEKEPEFKTLSPQQQNEALSRAETLVTQNLIKTFGLGSQSSDTLGNALYNFLLDTIGSLGEKFGTRFLFIWALAAFAILRGLGTLFDILFSIGIALIYELMVGLNVIRVIGETRTKERVEYS